MRTTTRTTTRTAITAALGAALLAVLAPGLAQSVPPASTPTGSTPSASAPAASAPAAAIKVEYLNPDQFSDVGNRRPVAEKVRDLYLEQLQRHLGAAAVRVLAPGQTLEVVITDVDMAGAIGMKNNVRVVRDGFPPRIALGFKLIGADGAIIGEGGRRLANPGFLWDTYSYRGDTLQHEKRLLDMWLEEEFVQPRLRGQMSGPGKS